MKIYLENSPPAAGSFTLKDEFWDHYLTHVRRLSAGERLEIAGPDRVVEAELTSLEPLQFDIFSVRPTNKPNYSLWLLQALTRKKKIEDSIKRGTELGITHFIPLISEHTVRRPNNPSKQRDRWRRIALDATRITGRDRTPKIYEPLDFKRFPEVVKGIDKLFWGEPNGQEPAAVFPDSPANVAFLVGPEGDFSAEEKDFIRQNDATSVSLGDAILRSGTAALALATLWLHYTDNLASL